MAQPTDTISTLTLQSTSPAAAHAHAHALAHAEGLSSEGIAIAAIAALVALACIAWGIARALSFEPRWTLSLRHAIAEAGFRASATWDEFSDWARLGR